MRKGEKEKGAEEKKGPCLDGMGCCMHPFILELACTWDMARVQKAEMGGWLSYRDCVLD